MMAPQTAKPKARATKATKEPSKPKQTDEDSAMRRIGIGKVVINIGVGKSGEAVERATKVLEQITSQKPSPRKAKKSIRDFGTHQGEPIGLVVTTRGQERCRELIGRLLTAREKKMNS